MRGWKVINWMMIKLADGKRTCLSQGKYHRMMLLLTNHQHLGVFKQNCFVWVVDDRGKINSRKVVL